MARLQLLQLPVRAASAVLSAFHPEFLTCGKSVGSPHNTDSPLPPPLHCHPSAKNRATATVFRLFAQRTQHAAARARGHTHPHTHRHSRQASKDCCRTTPCWACTRPISPLFEGGLAAAALQSQVAKKKKENKAKVQRDCQIPSKTSEKCNINILSLNIIKIYASVRGLRAQYLKQSLASYDMCQICCP